jgi:hypothetical protein
MSRVPFLWLCGASGTGKSFTAFEIFSRLWRAGVMTARVDFDDIGLCHPWRDEDPDNHRLKAANLGALWENFHRVGAKCLVGSGCVEDSEVVAIYRDAVPGSMLTLCRLRVGADEQRARISRRGRLLGAGTGAGVASMTIEHVQRTADEAVREAEQLDQVEIADFTVDTDGIGVTTVATRVLERSGGWPYHQL